MNKKILGRRPLLLKDLLNAVAISKSYEAKFSGDHVSIHKVDNFGFRNTSYLTKILTIKNGAIAPRETARLNRGERKKIAKELHDLDFDNI